MRGIISWGGRSMKAKRCLSVLMAAVWMISSVSHAQQPRPIQTFPAPSPLVPGGVTETVPQPAYAERGGLSDWITYRRECCEGRFDRATPLYTELYLQAGPSFPVGGATLPRE